MNCLLHIIHADRGGHFTRFTASQSDVSSSSSAPPARNNNIIIISQKKKRAEIDAIKRNEQKLQRCTPKDDVFITANKITSISSLAPRKEEEPVLSDRLIAGRLHLFGIHWPRRFLSDRRRGGERHSETHKKEQSKCFDPDSSLGPGCTATPIIVFGIIEVERNDSICRYIFHGRALHSIGCLRQFDGDPFSRQLVSWLKAVSFVLFNNFSPFGRNFKMFAISK